MIFGIPAQDAFVTLIILAIVIMIAVIVAKGGINLN